MIIYEFAVIGINTDNDSETQLLVPDFASAVFASTGYYGLIDGIGYPSIIAAWMEGHLESISPWTLAFQYDGRPQLRNGKEDREYILNNFLPVYQRIDDEWVCINDQILEILKEEFIDHEGDAEDA